ncbi:hypothetical protein CXG81DRAFT_326, partial [Caulochytrium protostelioides]
HPNMVEALDLLSTPDHWCLVLEYLPAGDMFSLIVDAPETLTPREVARLFAELAMAVGYMHRKHVVHGDLKIENVLFTANRRTLKVTDFGLATWCPPGQRLTARCGSEEYVAPEVIQGLAYEGPPIDVWALGVILFALLTKELPFVTRPGERTRAMFHRIARAEYKWPAGVAVDPLAKDLVGLILVPFPSRRATIPQILAHPFLAPPDPFVQ